MCRQSEIDCRDVRGAATVNLQVKQKDVAIRSDSPRGTTQMRETFSNEHVFFLIKILGIHLRLQRRRWTWTYY